ncbi:MAG TPA: MFS transporter [Steroidobacteraceae bacterium]|nr:MFS transporter [Steroidobacteraceae bacterium]
MRSLGLRQAITVLLLFAGYAACYFCRADLSVSTPLLVEDLARHGVGHDRAIVQIGSLASLGVLAYALGKFFLAGLGDFWGGRWNFLLGLAGATLFTALFAATGAWPIFTVAWIGNRLTQSGAWAGLIKVSSKWFDYCSYGTIVGILSVSYLVGDAVARGLMGLLMQHGAGWRAIFYFAAAVAGTVLLANVLCLRESRAELGYREAKPNPLNVFGEAESRPQGLPKLLLPLLRNRAFMLVCALSLGSTIVRETFNTWTPVYLRDDAGFAPSRAASLSGLFPAAGVLSVLAAGWLSDRLGPRGRSLLLFIGLGAAAVALLLLALAPSGSWLPLALIGAIAFCLLGPYSYLGGAMALDFGGKQGGAVSSGIIDGVGYLGGVLAGDSVARISVAFGWRAVFLVLAAITALATLGAGRLYARGAARIRSSIPGAAAAAVNSARE